MHEAFHQIPFPYDPTVACKSGPVRPREAFIATVFAVAFGLVSLDGDSRQVRCEIDQVYTHW